MPLPYSTKELNEIAASKSPSTLHVTNTAAAFFFRKYFFEKAIAQVKPTVPEYWPTNRLMYLLFGDGYCGIFETDIYGIIYDRVGLCGYNVFYQPSHFIVANPMITGNQTVQIGTQGVLLHLQPDYCGIVDICIHYGDLMAIATETLTTNLFNSKLSFVFAGKSKATAEALKKMYDLISRGEPAAFVDEKLFETDMQGHTVPLWQMFQQDVGRNYISDRILSDMRKIEAMFDAQVGIPNANTDKRERLISSEVEANDVSTYSLISLWIENLQKGAEEAHKMFGLTKKQLWFDWRFPPEKGGAANAGNAEPMRSV